MNFSIIKSHAKINLALHVVGKTSYLHKVESIVAFISLHDVVYIKKIKSKNHKIFFKGEFSKKISKNNTISKLLEILDDQNLLNSQKFYIKIYKKIPIKAGLGGGSMNAASILKYFIKKKMVKISNKKKIEICKSIGSDVILGINSINSILTSNNHIKYFRNCKKFYVIVVKPNFGCSTKDIYSRVRKFDKPKLSRPLRKMFNFEFIKEMDNSLEKITLRKYSKLKKVKLFLENLSHPGFVRMTGSGSAFVVYFQSKKRCEFVKKQFNKQYKNYWSIASKTI